MTAPDAADRLAVARRAVLDHLLALVASAGWGDALVLRGSMAVLAWVGDAAREPADLDFVVLPERYVPVDGLDPYPYVDGIDAVQQWPEAVGGAAGPEMWTDGEEEFETRGLRPRPPTDGLTWERDPDPDGFAPWNDLLELVRRQPRAAPGVVLDAEGACRDDSWGADYDGYDAVGVRLFVSWQADGLPVEVVQIDFARDERLPEPPVWTLVPRGDGGAPALVRTASRELSLAWKLLWLNVDAVGLGRPRCKDLYDAVVLAEDDRTGCPSRLLRRLLAEHPAEHVPLDEVRISDADWAAFRRRTPGVAGGARGWLRRLAAALDAASARGEAPAR